MPLLKEPNLLVVNDVQCEMHNEFIKFPKNPDFAERSLSIGWWLVKVCSVQTPSLPARHTFTLIVSAADPHIQPATPTFNRISTCPIPPPPTIAVGSPSRLYWPEGCLSPQVTSTQNNKADPSTPASKARVSPYHLHPDARTPPIFTHHHIAHSTSICKHSHASVSLLLSGMQ